MDAAKRAPAGRVEEPRGPGGRPLPDALIATDGQGTVVLRYDPAAGLWRSECATCTLVVALGARTP